MIAIIRNIRPGFTANGSHICTTICPNCQDMRTLTYCGWSAIVCRSCHVVLYRDRRSMEADNA